MKITHAIVLDALNHYNAVSLLPKDRSFQFECIQLLTGEPFTADPAVLYLGTFTQVKALRQSFLKEICIICSGKEEQVQAFLQHHSANLILLPENENLSAVVNQLLSVFHKLKNWSNQVEQAILSGTGYQEMIDLGKYIFGENPIIFVNASYNILGSSVNSTPYNERVNEILSLGYYSKENTDALASMGYQAKGSRLTTPTRIDPPTYMGCPLFVLAFHAGNGIFLGFITIYFVKDFPTDGMFDLFSYFATQIRNYYYAQSVIQDTLIPTPLERFMTDLIEHTYEEESYLIDRARVLKLPLNASYRLGIIQWEDFSLNQANYVMGRLRTSLNFPYFKIILFHQSVLMIFQGDISSLKLIEEVNQFFGEFTNLLQICKGYAGFSTITDSLLKLDISYKQACTAAKFGRQLAPEQDIYFYSQYYIYDMLDTYTEKYNLRDMFVQKLKLLDNPDEGNFSNLELLRYYLLTERSISTTAKLMHMHRNSVIYRLGKIQDLLGINMDNPDVRLRLLISFKILELMQGHLKSLPPQEVAEEETYSDLTTHE